jgi:hypothetical protein
MLFFALHILEDTQIQKVYVLYPVQKRKTPKKRKMRGALYELCHSNVTPSTVLRTGESAGQVAYNFVWRKAQKNNHNRNNQVINALPKPKT